MRKIIFWNLISIDGFFEGPNSETDWHNVDDEFNEFAVAFLGTLDTLLFGRKTYELMAGYWPTDMAVDDDPFVAAKMNSLKKVVFSKTLSTAGWENTRLVKENIKEEVEKIKNEPGRDIAVFGSSDLSVELMKHDLIDEFRVLINPVILGGGKTIFKGISGRYKLKLIDTKVFKSGNVLLYYQPDKS